MKTEIEAKFLDVDFDDVRTKLKQAGAVCERPMRLMRRAIIQNEATGRDGYLRLRDEGDRVTLTHKHFTSLSIDGAKEVEVIVSEFDGMRHILEAGGLKVISLQESKRETWQLGDTEIVLDEWPWLRPYIEIEAESESMIAAAAEKLGFDMAEAVYGDVMVAYRAQYPQLRNNKTIGDLPQVRFSDPLPDMLGKAV